MSPTNLHAGYIASGSAGGSNYGTYAVDATTLIRQGISHTAGIGGLELDLRGDMRLQELRQRAQLLRRYSDPDSPDYIANVLQRERIVTAQILESIDATYGAYSDETRRHGNDEERRTQGRFWNDTPALRNMPAGILVCRHFAPIVSILLHDAGIDNHLVSSRVGYIAGADGQYTLDNGDGGPGYHAYVVTQGGGVVETTQGPDANAYRPILNGVTVHDIVHHGRVAITTESLDGRYIYGGGTGDGDIDHARVTQGQELEIQRFNEQRELFRAVQNNDIATVRTLLERGVYVNTRDIMCDTPLYYARLARNEEMIRLLESHGAQVHPTPRRTEPASVRSETASAEAIYQAEEQRWQADTYRMQNLTSALSSLGHSSDRTNPAVGLLTRASRDANGRIRLDDPQNIPVLREALEAARDREQAIASANRSIMPRWARWGDGVVREQTSLSNVRFYEAALNELNAPEFATRCRAHEDSRHRHLARLAETEQARGAGNNRENGILLGAADAPIRVLASLPHALFGNNPSR